MCQRRPVCAVGLVQELEPKMRPKLERTLGQPQLKRSRDELPIGSAVAEAELGNRQSSDLDYMLSRERREPMIPEQRLSRFVKLDIPFT